MTKQIEVVIVGSGNKTVDELAKKLTGLQSERVALDAGVDALKVKLDAADENEKTKILATMKRIEEQVEHLNQAIANVGIRPATEEECRTALQAITNMDLRRRAAPNYIHGGKAFVRTEIVKVVKPDTSAEAPPTKKQKKSK